MDDKRNRRIAALERCVRQTIVIAEESYFAWFARHEKEYKQRVRDHFKDTAND